MSVTNENLIDFVSAGYGLIPWIGVVAEPAVSFFLKESFGLAQSQSVPDLIVSLITEYSLNDD
ncbi:hypothetical protein K7432_006319 [Basidiobolus ranarum]|uniref:Uncharacterized protein n=1 Tax=Basidiobolus ranarum TaxID=34480 RepID=A0ABR2W1V7_9FUNG